MLKKAHSNLLLVLAHLAITAGVGWYIYHSIPYFVYPEYSYYATGVYELQPRPSFQTLLDDYNILHGHSWYRPTAVDLIPFLLQWDIFNPRSIVATNVTFFAFTAFLASALFLAGASLPARVFSTLILFCSPALMDSYYFPIPDASYILFSIIFLWFLRRAYRQEQGRGSLAFASIFFLLAITSKEISVLAAFIAPLLMFLDQPVRWRRIAALCIPFMLLSFAFYAVMLFRIDVSNDSSYSSVPTLARLDNILHMLAFVSNFKFPRSWFYPGWATPGYLYSFTALWAFIWIGSVLAFFGAWRSWDVWRMAAAACIALIPLGAVALMGGQAHHAFPTLAAISLFLPLVGGKAPSLAAMRWPQFRPRGLLYGLVLGFISLGLVLGQAGTAGTLLTTWRIFHNNRYNTCLFQDEEFHKLAARTDVYFVVEECPDRWSTGCFVGVRPYLGRSLRYGDEEYVTQWDPALLPTLKERHPGMEIWLVKCQWMQPQPYVLQRLWPES